MEESRRLLGNGGLIVHEKYTGLNLEAVTGLRDQRSPTPWSLAYLRFGGLIITNKRRNLTWLIQMAPTFCGDT
jgi:hypothetical protein